MNKRSKILLFLSFMLLGMSSLHAQRVALKTNAVYWAALSPNLGVEARLSRRFTLNADIAGNPFSIGTISPKFIQFQPELRYWFNRPMVCHFMGVTALISNYDMRIKSHYYQGDAYAAGVTYGYAWVLGRHWNMEATIGAGIMRYRNYKYGIYDGKPLQFNNVKTTLAPVKLGLSFSYIFK